MEEQNDPNSLRATKSIKTFHGNFTGNKNGKNAFGKCLHEGQGQQARGRGAGR